MKLANGLVISMQRSNVMSSIVLFAMAMLGTCACPGFARSIDLSMSISTNGFSTYRFGDAAESVLGKPFSPSLVPGSNGEEFLMKDIEDSRFGFDSLHLGFTMESQRLCKLGLCRNFDYAVADTEIYGMLTNVFLWIRATFGDSVKVNPSFDLHSPSHALHAKVETGSLELRLEASRRHDVTMAWLMMSMIDKRLVEEASVEYDRISKDEAVKAEVAKRKNRAAWLAPLSFATPLYVVCCLPIFLVMMIVYVITMRMRKMKPLRILHWTDPFALLFAPYVWAFLEHVGQAKSLSNIVEFAVIGWAWCLCMAVRYMMSIMGRKKHERYFGYVTFVAVMLFAALMATLFPALSE